MKIEAVGTAGVPRGKGVNRMAKKDDKKEELFDTNALKYYKMPPIGDKFVIKRCPAPKRDTTS